MGKKVTLHQEFRESLEREGNRSMIMGIGHSAAPD